MIKALLDYQIADAKLKDIEKVLSGSEERKKAMSAKKYLEGVEDNVNKLDTRAAELNTAYEALNDDLNKLKEQSQAISDGITQVEDEKQATYLIKKSDELMAKIKTYSTNLSKLYEEIQTLLKEYSKIKATTKVAQEQYNENAKKYGELKESYKAEKDNVEKELEQLKSKVDPALMERYLRKRNNKIYPILYAVRGNVCGACNMELPMSEMNKLKNGEVIDCDQCGRMIYLSQD